MAIDLWFLYVSIEILLVSTINPSFMLEILMHMDAGGKSVADGRWNPMEPMAVDDHIRKTHLNTYIQTIPNLRAYTGVGNCPILGILDITL